MKFTFDNKEYELNKEKLSGFFNDEENPIKDLNEDIILSLLEGKTLDFEKAYYSAACNNCFNG